MVRPVLTYGSVVWWPRTKLVTTVSKLQKTQRLACSLISGCNKSTPSAALEVILGLTPLDLHIQQEAMASALRIKSTNQWKGTGSNTNHTRILDKAINVVPEAIRGTDKIANTYLDNKKYSLLVEENDPEITCNAHSVYYVYSDGAKNKEGAGCGVFSQDFKITEAQALPKTTSAFQAEAMGLLLAAKTVLSKEHTKQVTEEFNLKFITDSAAVIYALRKPTTRSRVILECHLALQLLADKHYIMVLWTKSHGICQGNKKADMLAKQGATKQLTRGDITDLCKPTAMEARKLLRTYTEKEQQNSWNRRNDCKHSKMFFPLVDKRITNKLLKLSRADLRLMVGIITGHCELNNHQHKIGATDSPLCRGCLKENETVEHVLLHCEATTAIRIKHGIVKPKEIDTATASSSVSNHHTKTTDANGKRIISQQPKAVLRYFRELGWLE